MAHANTTTTKCETSPPLTLTSLNYNCDKVESKEGGLRMDEVENKDLRER